YSRTLAGGEQLARGFFLVGLPGAKWNSRDPGPRYPSADQEVAYSRRFKRVYFQRRNLRSRSAASRSAMAGIGGRRLRKRGYAQGTISLGSRRPAKREFHAPSWHSQR